MSSVHGLERRYYRGRLYYRTRWSGGFVHFDRDEKLQGRPPMQARGNAGLGARASASAGGDTKQKRPLYSWSVELFNLDGDHMLTPEVLRREFSTLEAARQAFNNWLAGGGARAWA